MTTANAAPSALLVNHLCPLMTQWAWSRTAVVDSTTGFEPACSGSVMAKQLRMSPRASGSRYSRFCAGVPKDNSSSMLPTSGAWQLHT
jgi:hypothetical protein